MEKKIMDDKIQGVIAHLIIDGQLRITVTDFDGSEANGFSNSHDAIFKPP